MNKLQLGLYVRGHWEMQHGNRQAAIEAFNSLGKNPFAKAALASIYASENAPFEKLTAAYRDAIECGADELLLLYSKILDHVGGQENELKVLVQRIEEGLENNNAKIIAGFFSDRIAIGDFEGAALACNEAIQLRDAKTMSDLAEILLMPNGNEELIYFLSDKEIFNPKPWPVDVAVSIPDSKLFDSEGNVQGDRKAQQEAIREEIDSRRKFTNFVRSLFDQGEEQPLHFAGRLRAIFEITEDSNWTSRMVNEFSKSPEKTGYFWEDPDLILFYTEQLVASNIHFEVEWIRTGISQYGLEDLFDRTIELARTSEKRQETELYNSAGDTQPHIYIGNRELTVFEAFNETASGSSITPEMIQENFYCKLFDSGNLTDLRAIVTTNTRLAVQGAESYFDELSIFMVLANSYGQQGFHEYLSPALGIIEEADDADETFLNLLSQHWLEVGHIGFDERIYPDYRLPDLLSKKDKVSEKYRKAISQYFPLTLAVENLHLLVDDLLEELESGVNVVGRLSAALQTLLSDETAPLNDDIWWGEEIRYSFLDPFEIHDKLWTSEIFDLADAIATVDERYVCNLIEIDSERGSPFFQKTDLEKLIQNRWCDDDECDGLEEMAARHPNFR
jgi:hypothetical protein